MERDKRGRFIKKALGGTQLTSDNIITASDGKKYKLKNGLQLSWIQPLLDGSVSNPNAYNKYLTEYFDPVEENTSSNNVVENIKPLPTPLTTPPRGVVGGLDLKPISYVFPGSIPTIPTEPAPVTEGTTSPTGTTSLNKSTSNYDPLGHTKPFSINVSTPTFGVTSNFGYDPNGEQIHALGLRTGFGSNLSEPYKPQKIKVYNRDGKYVTQYGKEVNIANLDFNTYELDHTDKFESPSLDKIRSDARVAIAKEELEAEKEDSFGMNFVPDGTSKNKNKLNWLNRAKLSDFLQLTRAGIGYAVNNKIAERALEAEKPFLQDVSESHRSVYGDYRSQVEGEKAAAQLRNLASKPMTSDGALQQQMMLEAQIKGQTYIDQGRAKDEALIRQSREAALQQEKENSQQRMAAAMQNRKAMLTTQANKAQIENTRDSANYSQVLAPLLSGVEQRLRNKEAQRDKYQEFYDDALVTQDVWNNFRDNLTPEQAVLADKYKTGGLDAVKVYIGEDQTKAEAFTQLQRIMNNEAIRRKAALKGVYINSLNHSAPSENFGIFSSDATSIFKKGGTVKAKLNKRVKDNDRASRSIESSKKLAARLLEKALDSLYTYNDIEIVEKPARRKRKYQAGGNLPFVNFTPVFATSEKGTEQAESTKKGEDLTTKDVLTLLQDMDGLPSDMNFIVQALQDFQLREDMDPLGISSSSVTSQYINLINKIKVAKFNREEYNQAFNQLKGNGGLNELAITSDGLVVGTNEEGDFKYFTPEQASKGIAQKEGYQLLTNSNLLYLRANSSDAAFNHRLITVASNGIGIATVNKYITDQLASLGTSENSEQGYVSTQQGELLQGLQDFAKAVQNAGGQFDGTVNDLYKYKYLTKTQAEQAKKAMQYIYQTLPENAKALLKVKSDGSDNGALKLVETLISSQLDTTQQFDLDLAGGKTHKSTSGDGKDMSDLETSLPLNVLKDVGGVDSYLDIDRGDGIHMSVRGTQFNLIKTPNGEAILDTSISNMLHQSGLQSIVKDMRNIQFGDQKISPEALSYITYNNTGITRAILPIKPDGSVNLDLLEAYEKAEADIELSGDKSPENVKAIYAQYGISSLLNANGTYNQSKFAPFMVTEGYTTDALSGLKPSDFVMEYRGDEDAAIALMQKCLSVGSGKNVQTPEIDSFSWYNPMDWFGWTDTIFKGVLYIPITNNVNTAVFGANQTLDYDEALLQEEKYQNFEKMSNQRSTGADLLNI